MTQVPNNPLLINARTVHHEGMVQLELSYQLRGGVEEEDYDTWARQVALPFWQNQQGFRAIRGFYTLVGGGARIVAQVDFNHWDSLAAVMASDGYMRQRHELTTFANDIDSRVLVPTGRTPK